MQIPDFSIGLLIMLFWQIKTGLSGFDTPTSEAVEHHDFVVSELRDVNMQPSWEKALRNREILRA
jgi:hypothetical protein